MYYGISLMWMLSMTGFFSLLFRRKFETVFPLTLILPVFFVYGFGFLRQLYLGYCLTWIFCIFFYLWILFLILKDREALKDFRERYFSIGFFAFILLYSFVYIVFREAGFNFWDEFQHWGPMVRELVRNNTFYSVEESVLIHHKDYPPFYPVFEYIFCCFRGPLYLENRLYIANVTFMYGLFLPVLSGFKKEKLDHWIAALIVLIGIVFTGLFVAKTPNASDLAHVYNSIYIDWPLSVLTAYTLFAAMDEEKGLFQGIRMTACFGALLLMKQIGLPFCLLGILLLFLKTFFIDRKKISPVYASVLIAAGLFVSWKVYITVIGVAEQAQFSVSQYHLGDIPGIIKGTAGEAWQIAASANYLRALLERPLFLKPFALNYVFASLFLCVMLFVILRKKEGLFVSGVYFLGAAGYALVMYLSYIFSFGPSEGPQLASFDRYMITYLYIGVCLFFMTAVRTLAKEKPLLPAVICLLCICLFADFTNLKDLKPHKLSQNMAAHSSWANFHDTLDTLPSKKVLVVEQFVTDTFTDIMLYYEGCYDGGARLIRLGDRGWNTGQTITPTLKEWKELLSGYDYIYISNGDDYFIENYWDTITDVPFINEGMYEIHVSGEEVDLHCVNFDL